MSTASVETNASIAWRAVLATLPLGIAVVPWGMLTGALAIEIGLSVLQAQALSLLVFAGAAQLSATSLIAAGASPYR